MGTRLHRIVVRAAATAAACAAATLACADDDEDAPPAAEPGRLELSTTQQTVPGSAPLNLRAGAPLFQSATQTMAWARRDRVALGLGVEQRWPTSAEVQGYGPQPAAREANLLVGVAVDAGANAQLSWQRQLHSIAPPNPADPNATQNPGEVRLALTMRKRDALSDIRRGALLKMELSSGSALAIRPKHGRLALTYTSQW
jgi:hypothetical protein